ncbi:hypothetical protein ACVBEQ_09855 [Nakamurella sp. GG22]
MGLTRRWGSAIARATLLTAVLTGLFAMHVLTADDAATGHGALPVMRAAMHGVAHDPPLIAADVPITDTTGAVTERPGGALSSGHGEELASSWSGFDGAHGAMAGCILFLAVGGVAALLVQLRRLGSCPAAGPGGVVGPAVSDLRRRGPPDGWPRVSLCVIRV